MAINWEEAERRAGITPVSNVNNSTINWDEAERRAGINSPTGVNSGGINWDEAEAGAFGSPANEPDGFLDAFWKKANAGFGGVIGGVGDFAEANLGIGETLGNWGNQKVKDNTPANAKEYSLSDVIPFASDYWTNPQGATSDIGEFAGSSAAILPATVGIAAAVPEAPAVGIGAAGIKAASWLIPKIAQVGKQALGRTIVGTGVSSGIESAAEGGNTYRDLSNSGYSHDAAKSEANKVAAYNFPLTLTENAVEMAGLTGMFGKFLSGANPSKARKFITNAGATGAINAPVGAATELEQSILQEGAGDRPTGSFFSPSTWTVGNESAARAGLIGSGAMGGITGGVGELVSSYAPIDWNKAEQEALGGTLAPQQAPQQQEEIIPEYRFSEADNPDFENTTDATKAGLRSLWRDVTNLDPNAVITSGYRDAARNAAAGGVANSWHTKGGALDIAFDRELSPEEQQDIEARARNQGWEEVLWHDVGSGYHLHVGNYQGVAGDIGANLPASEQNAQNTRFGNIKDLPENATPQQAADETFSFLSDGIPMQGTNTTSMDVTGANSDNFPWRDGNQVQNDLENALGAIRQDIRRNVDSNKMSDEELNGLVAMLAANAQAMNPNNPALYLRQNAPTFRTDTQANAFPGENVLNQEAQQKTSQAITSAKTSLNQVPASFKKIAWQPNTVNVDIGGGKFNSGTNFLQTKGVTNLNYDPYNRSDAQNQQVVQSLSQNLADTATVANVLNVIPERESRVDVVRQAAKAIKPNGTAYFQIYEGDKSGNGRVTKVNNGVAETWQNNLMPASYVNEIKQYFGNVKTKGNIIEASAPLKNKINQSWDNDNGSPLFQSEAYRNSPSINNNSALKKWFGNSKIIDESGEPLTLWHQTGTDIEVFNPRSPGAGEFDNQLPFGIFMKPHNKDIGLPGKKQMPLYARIENPLRVTNRTELGKYLDANVKGYAELKRQLETIDSTYKKNADSLEDEAYNRFEKEWEPQNTNASPDSRGVAIESFFSDVGLNDLMKQWTDASNNVSAQMKALVNEHFSKSGHDGIILERDEGGIGKKTTKTFIALTPEQVKSTNNNGNFSAKNNNIYLQDVANEGNRIIKGTYHTEDGRAIITLLEQADASTFIHEMFGHHFIEKLMSQAKKATASSTVKSNAKKVLDYLGITDWSKATVAQKELLARDAETYIMTAEAPVPELKTVFQQFKQLLLNIYKSLTKSNVVNVTPTIKAVFDSLITPGNHSASTIQNASIGASDTLQYDTSDSSGQIDLTAATPENTVKRRQVIKELDSMFTKIRNGRLGMKGVRGWFNAATKVIRSKDYADFGTLAHEIGHFIDSVGDLRNLPQYHDELARVVRERFGTGYDNLTPDKLRSEGIAEFFRDYVFKPHSVATTFPTFTQAFDNFINQNPEMAKKVHRARQLIQTWQNQSAEARGRGAITRYSDRKESKTDGWSKKYLNFKRAWTDRDAALDELVTQIEKITGQKISSTQNPYEKKALENSASTTRANEMIDPRDGNTALVYRQFDKIYGANTMPHKVSIQGILNTIPDEKMNAKYPNYLKRGGLEDWTAALDTYLVAQRTIELRSYDTEYQSPISDKDAAAIVNSAPIEIRRAGDMYYKYSDNLLRLRVASGLISEDQYKKIVKKYKTYAPMHRDFDDSRVDAKIKTIKSGSAANVFSPLESVMAQTYAVFRAVERNSVNDSVSKLASIKGAARLVEAVADKPLARENVFGVYRGGRLYSYETTDDIYATLTSIDRTQANIFSSLLSKPASTLRFGATSTPGFIGKNSLKDTFTAAVFSQNGFIPIYDSLRGLASMIGNPDLYQEFLMSGAAFSSLESTARDFQAEKMAKMLYSPNVAGSKPLGKLKDVFINPEYEFNWIHLLRNFGERIEQAPRLREYELNRNKGRSIAESAFKAKNITVNFERGGTSAKAFNRYTAFFNAAIQGGLVFANQFRKDPVGVSVRGALWIGMPTVILWALNNDEDWYKEKEDWEKNAYWMANVGGYIVHIPKSQGPGYIYGSLVEAFLSFAKDKDPRRLKAFSKEIASSFVASPIPIAPLPIIEGMTNYSFFRGRNIVPLSEQKLPPHMQYGAFTSEPAKVIGELTGTSPRLIDNAIAGYFGSMGRAATYSIDAAMGKYDTLPEQGIAQMPGVSSFIGEPFSRSQSVRDYEEDLARQTALYNELKLTGKKPEGLDAAKYGRVTAVGKQMKKLNDASKQILNSKKLTPAQKKEKLDSIQMIRIKLAQSALSKK